MRPWNESLITHIPLMKSLENSMELPSLQLLTLTRDTGWLN